MDSKRIVSVDFFRGLAILGVVLTHCLIYGVFYSTANALATVPVGLLAVLSPIVLISPMAGLFAFISVTANTFTALRRFENGSSAKNVIQPLLITSAALIVIHFLFSLLLKNSSASSTGWTSSIWSSPRPFSRASEKTSSIRISMT